MLPDSAKLQEEEARYANAKGYSRHAPRALPLYEAADAAAALGAAADAPLREAPRDPARVHPELFAGRAHPGERLGPADRCRRLRPAHPHPLLRRPGALRRPHPPRPRAPAGVRLPGGRVDLRRPGAPARHGRRMRWSGRSSPPWRAGEPSSCPPSPSAAPRRCSSSCGSSSRPGASRPCRSSSTPPWPPTRRPSTGPTGRTTTPRWTPCSTGASSRSARGRLTFTRTTEQSKAINRVHGPCIIISASGHGHRRARPPPPGAAPARAVHDRPPGRIPGRRDPRLAPAERGRHRPDAREGRPGPGPRRLPPRASRPTGTGTRWRAGSTGRPAPPRRTFCVHGEPTALSAQAERIAARGWEVHVPAHLETVELG